MLDRLPVYAVRDEFDGPSLALGEEIEDNFYPLANTLAVILRDSTLKRGEDFLFLQRSWASGAKRIAGLPWLPVRIPHRH